MSIKDSCHIAEEGWIAIVATIPAAARTCHEQLQVEMSKEETLAHRKIITQAIFKVQQDIKVYNALFLLALIDCTVTMIADLIADGASRLNIKDPLKKWVTPMRDN